MNVSDLMRRPYHIVLRYDDTEGGEGWVAAVAELPGCLSQGDTIAEASENIRDAMEGWFAWMIENGRTIPEPMEVVYPELPLGDAPIDRPRFVEPAQRAMVRRSMALSRSDTGAPNASPRELAHR